MTLPPFFYFTDDLRGADPLQVAPHLPRGTGIIFRHYNTEYRAEMAFYLSELCKKQDLTLFIAKTPELALKVKAAGCHLPDHRISDLSVLKTDYPQLLFSAACHDEASLLKAQDLGAEFAFLSPVFPTQSHPGKPALGLQRAQKMIKPLSMPVYALGGVSFKHQNQLEQAGFSGFGAISEFEKAVSAR